MWKKSEPEVPQESDYSPKTTPSQLKERALIGPSIQIKGDITGDEDLQVQGKVEGKLELHGRNVTVGPQGVLHADIWAKVISVEGEVRGNLFGEEKIIIRKTGRVRGNLVAPRVGLEDGSSFKGSIDMETGKSPKKPVAQDRPPASSAPTASKDEVSSLGPSKPGLGVPGGTTSSTK